MMTNFNKYAGPLIKNPSWDPGNKYTMAWQSGWTAIGYNSSVIKNPGTSVGILFDKKYSGKVGMMSDPQELGSLGPAGHRRGPGQLDRIGVGQGGQEAADSRRATGWSAPTTTRATSTT